MHEHPTTDANRELIRGFWDDLYRKDFDACGAYFAADGVYTDVPVGEQGAVGPAEVAARLRLGLEPITGYVHILRNIAADGDVVITEHVEEWLFHTGENVMHPFVSVMEVRERFIVRWHDYSHLQNLTSNAPAWWLEHIAQGWRDAAPNA